MSCRLNVLSAKCLSVKGPVGETSVGLVSVGQMSIGQTSDHGKLSSMMENSSELMEMFSVNNISKVSAKRDLTLMCIIFIFLDEAFAPFRSVPLLFAPVGGSNTALVNHVIAKHHGIEDTSQCLIVCMMSKCRSLNFDKLEKICEVNDVTKDEYPRDLTAKAGFQYYHPMRQPLVVNKGRN